jgi:hypothetical protein
MPPMPRLSCCFCCTNGFAFIIHHSSFIILPSSLPLTPIRACEDARPLFRGVTVSIGVRNLGRTLRWAPGKEVSQTGQRALRKAPASAKGENRHRSEASSMIAWRTLIPPGETPGYTAGKMPAATVQAGAVSGCVAMLRLE